MNRVRYVWRMKRSSCSLQWHIAYPYFIHRVNRWPQCATDDYISGGVLYCRFNSINFNVAEVWVFIYITIKVINFVLLLFWKPYLYLHTWYFHSSTFRCCFKILICRLHSARQWRHAMVSVSFCIAPEYKHHCDKVPTFVIIWKLKDTSDICCKQKKSI